MGGAADGGGGGGGDGRAGGPRLKDHDIHKSIVREITRAIVDHPNIDDIRAGRAGSAVRMLDEMTRADGTDTVALAAKAYGSLKGGRYEEALEAFSGIVRSYPKLTRLHEARGRALYGLARHRESLEAFDRAVSIEPGRAAAHNGRGRALLGLAKHKEALAAFDRAVSIEPERASSHDGRGRALYGLARYKGALAAFDRTLSINPGRWKAHLTRGEVLKKLGKYRRALAALDEAPRRDPEDEAAADTVQVAIPAAQCGGRPAGSRRRW